MGSLYLLQYTDQETGAASRCAYSSLPNPETLSRDLVPLGLCEQLIETGKAGQWILVKVQWLPNL